ncbi:MAG: phosphoglucosamine mutase [Halobacteriota archaeon]
MFGTSGVRGPVGTEITAALALDIGRAVGVSADRVVVGRDARDSGRALVHALTAGLVESGVDVVDVGTASTPTIARAVGSRTADAGIAVTASHNPPADNGIKLWTPSGQAFDTDAQHAIAARIDAGEFDFAPWDAHGTVHTDATAIDDHHASLVEYATRRDVTLSDLSVVVDIGNGMGQITASALFELGADVATLNAQPDGRFPGRASEPTAATTTALQAQVAATDADLGIAHDGDADRMMAVTETGEFVSGDLLLAMFATEVASAGDRIAAPVDTSLAVDDALSDVGASVVRTRVGDVYVAEQTRASDVVFGGEPSGAWIFPDETYCPDGPLAAIELAALAVETPLADRIDRIDTYPIERETVQTETKRETMDALERVVTERYTDVTTIDGVRVELDTGWFLVRASGTQPIIRMTAESRDESRTAELLEEASAVLEEATASR